MEIKFSYIAAGKDGSRQNGTITAKNEAEARAKLHSMGFSVLKIVSEGSTNISHKLKNEKVKNNVSNKESNFQNKELDESVVFEFSGFKSSGEEVDGSIEAKNGVLALKRLFNEYKFNIEWIVEKNLSPAIKEHKKKGSVDKILAEAFDEGIIVKSPIVNSFNNNSSVDVSKEEKEALEEDIKKYLKSVKYLLKNSNGIITGIDLSNIQNQLVELEKIQKSNNLSLIQSELEDILSKVSLFFNSKNKEDLPIESIDIIDDISSYLGLNTRDFIKEKILPILGKFSFLRRYLSDLKDYLNKKKDENLTQKRSNLYRYIKRFFLHLKFLIFSTNTSERKKRLEALKKTYSLIHSTYKTYSGLKTKVDKNKHKFHLDFIRGNSGLYNELRFITGIILAYYFVYFIFMDFGIRKGLFVNYELGFFTIGSGFILTFLFTAFIVNFMSFLKLKFFLKSVNFNIFFGWPFFILVILFYYINY